MNDSDPLSRLHRIDELCEEFKRQWRAGKRIPAHEFLARVSPGDRPHLLRELANLEIALKRDQRRKEDVSLSSTRSHQADEDSRADWLLSSVSNSEAPTTLGRYVIERILGQGGFAVVYLAHDPDLDRNVALKVPRRFESEHAVQNFVAEARKVAQMDHPGIVRVYDVQRDPGVVYIVQQYIEGQDLAAYAKAKALTPKTIAELMIAVAEAVGYAHERRLVHRDLKPANILMDADGQPHVADFGIALHESAKWQHQNELAGTCAYMSPEQVRREVHRLDGRSDIWSLGVILYELLAGRRPFVAENQEDLLDEILHANPKPLRQINASLPRELSRVCQVCLAKRASDRYSATVDLVEDLRHWLSNQPTAAHISSPSSSRGTPASAAPAKIVPKGLRSFDAGDKDFFLELLPGPRDRAGLPKTVRFWKTQIEQTDSERTFAVGLMYGPSGCGKSSLAKAGLLPSLSDDVLPLYVEATSVDTEPRLDRALRKHCREFPADADLPEMIRQLRDSGGCQGRKVLIVLDQFEQWLHAHESREESELILALRQCDGASVQCLVMVRDDFWMSATRFMQALEIPLVEGHNSEVVDLFDLDHARSVLTAFGRAYGRLPRPPAELNSAQTQFIQHAVGGLADDGKVICVRLAVFAEMMKARPWTKESLRAVGGTEGVGTTFLHETFSGKMAPPAHRLHQNAVRSVLNALLPDQGSDIKGQMKSYDELLQLSGYAQRRTSFDALLGILDNEVRLITPTELEEQNGEDPAPPSASRAKYYQLTHDFLVPSLRQWLKDNQSIASIVHEWCSDLKRVTFAGTYFLVMGVVVFIFQAHGLLAGVTGWDLHHGVPPEKVRAAMPYFGFFSVLGLVIVGLGIMTIRRQKRYVVLAIVLALLLAIWEAAVSFFGLDFQMGGFWESREDTRFVFFAAFQAFTLVGLFSHVVALYALNQQKRKLR